MFPRSTFGHQESFYCGGTLQSPGPGSLRARPRDFYKRVGPTDLPIRKLSAYAVVFISSLTYGKMYGMVRTTVYLPEKLKASLKKLADEENRSEAEIIREAINKVVTAKRHVRPRIPLTSEGLGDPLIADKVDELLWGGSD